MRHLFARRPRFQIDVAKILPPGIESGSLGRGCFLVSRLRLQFAELTAPISSERFDDASRTLNASSSWPRSVFHLNAETDERACNHPCGRGNRAISDAQRRCSVCYLKTIPIPVKFDRQGHSRNFHVGFGPATSTNLYVHPPPAYIAGRTRERVSPHLS